MGKFRAGDKIVMSDRASKRYGYSQAGARGVVISEDSGSYTVRFECSTLTDYNEDRDFAEFTSIEEDYMILVQRASTSPFNHGYARTGKIAAIKAMREFVPGLGLKDAKDIVESIAEGMQNWHAVTDEKDRKIAELESDLRESQRMAERYSSIADAQIAHTENVSNKLARTDAILRRALDMLTADQLVTLILPE